MAGSTNNIAGIILAAGMGSRMGKTKQLLPLEGKPLVAHAVEQGAAAGLSPLILVLGHDAEKIKTQLPPCPVIVTVNQDYHLGMSTSLKTGLNSLKTQKPVEGALFMLGDQPRVKVDTLSTLQHAARKTPNRIIIPTYRGRRGNPVYFDRCFFSALKQITGDKGGRELIRQYASAVLEIEVDDFGICQDIDMPEDYQRLCDEKKNAP